MIYLIAPFGLLYLEHSHRTDRIMETNKAIQ